MAKGKNTLTPPENTENMLTPSEILGHTPLSWHNGRMLESLKDFYNLPAKNFMSRQLEFVSPRDSLKKAIKIMTQRNIGALIVLDLENRPGIVTERDILIEMEESNLELSTPVQEIMTVLPVSIDINECIGVACQIMVAHGFRHVLIEECDEVIGIISMRDIARALTESMPLSCLRRGKKKRG